MIEHNGSGISSDCYMEYIAVSSAQPEVVPNDLANFRIGKSLNEIHILYIPIDTNVKIIYKFILTLNK